MGLLGSIAGGALGAAGSIFGGISASKAMKKAKRNIEAQRKKNQDWYDRRYNEDATQRADAQRILTLTEESIRQRNRAAEGSAAVMGGTEESVAATKAANAKALSDATARIAADADAQKDRTEAVYLSNDNAFVNRLNNMEIEKADNIRQAVAGVGAAGAEIAKTL